MDQTDFLESDPLAPPPAMEEVAEFHSLDPRHIRADQISNLIFAAVVGVGFTIGLLIFLLAAGATFWWLIVAAAGSLITILLFVFGVIWPPIEFRHARWRLDHTGLEIHRGVLWRHRICIPIARVQHADVSQGPLQRQFELGKLTVHTAGTQNASVELSGLSHATAIALRDEVVRQRKAHDVV